MELGPRLTLIACLMAMASRADYDIDTEWSAFKAQHGKAYANQAEDNLRKVNFADNLQRIKDHNDAGLGFELGVNEYADMTNDEFRDKMLMKNFQPAVLASLPSAGSRRKRRQTVPDAIDWTTSGCITAIKNQGQCGSCYAFASVAALEYYNCKKLNRLTVLSEQNIIDCTNNVTYGNLGCNGGYTFASFQYVQNQGGIDKSSSYPYAAKVGSCQYKSRNSAGTCAGWVRVLPWGNETALQQVVGTVGPVTVLIDASLTTFQLYKSGVYDDQACNRTVNVDHAVTAVGYATTANGTDYWLIKNSWGTTWGMNGYLWLARNDNNLCCVATFPYYPLV